MKKFYILWTYIANYSKVMEVTAESAEHALKMVNGFYSDEFRRVATVYIFETPPILIFQKGRKVHINEVEL